MLNLIKKITLVVVSIFFAQMSFALDIRTDNYNIYLGDVDGDGDGDYYFAQNPWTLILHGDIATPLVLKGTKNFVAYNNAGNYSAPQSFTMLDADLALKLGNGTLKLGAMNSDVFVVSSSSGQNTLLLRGANASTPALLLNSFSSVDLPTVVKTYSVNSYVGISDRNVQLQIVDINGDGKNDVVLKDNSSAEYAYLAEGSGNVPNRYFEVTPAVSQPIVDATYVGTTGGQFRVDESGAATYSIPINVPEGIAGVNPQIGLNYSSNAGSGIAGRGWSLSGISAISRCRQTLSQDTNPQPITWSANDRFCLDGQRLILTGGTYGSVGSTYKTEIDSVIEVKAVGGSVGHPDKFEVKAKDGSITTYGATGSSLSEVSGSTSNPSTTILTWAISRFQDNMGNAIDYEYGGDAATGQVIKNIFYAFNTYAQAQAKIEFIYGSRNDSASAYVAGYLFGQTQKLNQIKVYNSSVSPSSTPVLSELRRYNLNYLPNTLLDSNDNLGIKDISRLASIQECRGSACYAPTHFSWGGGTKISFESVVPKLNVSHGTDGKPILQKLFADVTGDGRQDLVYIVLQSLINASTGKADVTLVTRFSDDAVSNSAISVKTFTVDNYRLIQLQNFDYNADGRQDIAIYDSKKWYLYKSAPASSEKIWSLDSNPINLGLVESALTFADANSDGLADAISAGGYYPLIVDGSQPVSSSTYYKFGSKVVFTLDPSNQFPQFGSSPYVPGSPIYCTPSGIPPQFGIKNDTSADFNGDGVTDFIGIYWNYYNCINPINGQTPVTVAKRFYYPFVVLNNKLVKYSDVVYSVVTTDIGSSDDVFKPVDLNGDGLSDIVITNISSYQYRLNTGAGFAPTVNWVSLPSYTTEPKETVAQFVDYNNDGMVDLFWNDRNTSQLKVLLWNSTSPINIATGSNSTTSQFILQDVSGDGIQDIIGLHNSTNTISALAGQYKTAGTGPLYCVVFTYDDQGCLTWAPSDVLETQTRQNLTITGITNGTGAVTRVSYGTLANSGRYTRTDVDPTLNTSSTVFECFQSGDPGYCVGEFIYYTYNTAQFYTRLNSGWDLPTGSTTLVPNNANKGAPVLEINGSMMIVTAVESNAPKANDSVAYSVDQQAMSKVDYHYGEAKMQASGRGFLGFAKLKTIDAQSGVTTVSFYRQDFPFIGSPISTTVYSDSTANAKVLSHSLNKWDLKQPVSGAKTYLPYLLESTEKTYDADDSVNPVLQTISTTNTYDNFGNVTQVVATTSGKTASGVDTSLTQTVNNTYGSTDEFKRYGRLTQTKVDTVRDGSSPVSKTSTFTYYPQGGSFNFLLESEIVKKSDQVTDEVKTVYQYDNFGNKKTVSLTALNTLGVLETRNTFNDYSTDGRYLVSTRNDLSQSAQITARNEYGQAVSATDANGVPSGTTYFDAMGNEYMKKNADGSWSRTESRWCNGSTGITCPTGAVYRTRSRVSGGSEAMEYFDKLGRNIRSSKRSFDGNWSNMDTEYDNLSRIKRQSIPFSSTNPVAGQATAWTIIAFDKFGRPTKITAPDLSSSTLAYSGNTTTSTNAKNQKKYETKNGLGQLVQVEDALQGLIKYEYDVYGGLLKATTRATHADGQVRDITVRMCYDNLGRKTAMLDPDKSTTTAAQNDLNISCDLATYGRAGWWTYKYNGFGELIEQADPKGQRTQMHYDKLGRMIGRVDFLANNSIESFTQWFYEKGVSAQNTGINGKLTAVVMDSSAGLTTTQINTALTTGVATCSQTSSSCHKTLNEFDPLTRPTVTRSYYPGSSTEYVNRVDYDSFGRASKQYDALDNQLTANGSYLASGTRTSYNDYGYAQTVVDIGTGSLLSQVKTMNARGQVTREFRGNGVDSFNTYNDLTGQLTNQQASIGSWTLQDMSYQWDVLGNLQYRTNHASKINGSGSKNKSESFCYDGLNRLIKTVAGATTNPTCSSPDVTYDGFGNIKSKAGVGNYAYSGANAGPHAVTTAGTATYTYDANGNAITGDSRNFEYTSYDMASKITKGSDYVEFKYGPDRARWKRTDKKGSATTHTTYIGNIERIETVGMNVIEWKRYVGGAIFTYQTNMTNQVQASDKAYVYNDHLGSVDVITNAVGTITNRQSMSFDAWGLRRSGEDWSAMTAAQIQTALVPPGFSRPITTRGFTGHEMVDDMGIIHMNGRIYDAKIARFLQADPFVDGARDTQGYNRYSYVRNNPLNATDPSGYLSFNEFIHAVPVHRFLNKNMPWAIPVIQIALNFIPFAGPYVSAAFGANNAYYLSGGNDWAAIKSYGISMASAYMFKEVGEAFDGTSGGFWQQGGAGHIFAHAMVGGVISVAQGGKFGNGFVSAGLTMSIMGNMDLSDRSTSAIIGRTLIAGVVGGTISEITGGKFANGAITAAMAHLFNAESHAKRNQIRLSIIGDDEGLDLVKQSIKKYDYSSMFGDIPESGFDIEITFGPTDPDSLFEAKNSWTIVVNKDAYLSGSYTLDDIGSALGHEISHNLDHYAGILKMPTDVWNSEVKAYQWQRDNISNGNFKPKAFNDSELLRRQMRYKNCARAAANEC